MDGGEHVWLAPLLAFLVPAIGWGFREYWQRRNAKRQAAGDASEILSKKRRLLEGMISKAADSSVKESLVSQLHEVYHALAGLYSERLKRTLKDAGLPTVEALIADGQSQLKPQEASQLSKAVEQLNTLPLSLSTQDLLVLGSAYYHMQRYEDAIKIYEQILDWNPNDPITLTSRGVAYAE